MFNKTGVAVVPVTVDGTAATVLPYDEVRPQSKNTSVVNVFAVTVPFNVATDEVTPVAAKVTTAGGWAACPLMVIIKESDTVVS